MLEVTGGEALARLAALLGRPLPAAGAVTLGRLVADGETLDEVLVVGREAARWRSTCTGVRP